MHARKVKIRTHLRLELSKMWKAKKKVAPGKVWFVGRVCKMR